MELLAPAGGFSQLKAAIKFGADAVYLAADRFGMRARATNFSLSDIPRAVEIAHAAGVSVHVTCNILMSDSDLETLPEYLRALDAADVDALIISDLGALRLARQYAPHCEYHASTQASVSNVQAVLAWYEMGARRVVCAREMSLAEIAALKAALPADMKVETFAHGSMCMAVSGRCLISSYLTGRSGNRGHCTQPCRWMYTLEEEKRPGQHFPIEEDETGTFIMNAQDMNMLAHVREMEAAGIDSIKMTAPILLISKKSLIPCRIVRIRRGFSLGRPISRSKPMVMSKRVFMWRTLFRANLLVGRTLLRPMLLAGRLQLEWGLRLDWLVRALLLVWLPVLLVRARPRAQRASGSLRRFATTVLRKAMLLRRLFRISPLFM